MEPTDANESQKDRPNPGDPGPPVPDPEETKRVDPREDPRLPHDGAGDVAGPPRR